MANDLGVSLAWARIFFVYGPGEHQRRLAPSIIHALLSGRPAETGGGDRVRDYLYVDDAGGRGGLARSDLQGPVNIASGRGTRIADLAGAIGTAAGAGELLRVGALPDRSDEPQRLVAGVSRLASTGFAPTVDIHEGARRTVAWWRDRQP